MFIGHFAIGIGAKSLQPKLSLGTLFIAAQLLDLIWPILLLFGLERVKIVPGITEYAALDFEHYPISHSLIMAVLWGILFGILYYFLCKHIKSSLIIAACVISHWFLDLIVHCPDLPLLPNLDYKVGFGLWHSIYGTLVIETSLFVYSIHLFRRMKIKQDKAVSIGFYALVICLYIIYLFNSFGTIPEKVMDIAIGAQFQWLFVFWAYFIDRKKNSSFNANSIKSGNL